MWPFLSGAAASSPRTMVPLTMGQHQPGCGGGVIHGRWKLVLGNQAPAFWNGPEYPNGTTPAPISVDCGAAGCLYDIIADPTEHRDLAADPAHAETLANMTAFYNALAATAYQTPYVEGAMNCSAPRVAAMLEGGFWTPWTDEHA
eukprot:g6552.t1